MIFMALNGDSDSKDMEYWNEMRVKSLSTNSAWLDEVYLDAITLLDMAKTKGTSDSLRYNYTCRAIEALEEIQEFLKGNEED